MRCERPWYIWDMVLLGFLLLFGALGHARHLLLYLGGLRNDMGLPFGAAIWFVLLVPLAAICLLAMMMRIAWRWPRHIDRRGRLLVFQIVTISASIVYIGLPFLSIGPPGYKTYTRGLRQYARTNVDVAAIRTWLSTLDPNDCDGLEIDVRRGQDGALAPIPASPALPPCLVSLQPRYVTLALTEGQGLAVGLTWGSGLLGTWGLMVGPQTMTASPRDLCGWVDYRLEVRPGAYVWHNTE